MQPYGGREGSRAQAVAPVAAAQNGTAPRDADATGVGGHSIFDHVTQRALYGVTTFYCTWML